MRYLPSAILGILFTGCGTEERKTFTFQVPGPVPTAASQCEGPWDSIIVRNIAQEDCTFLLSYGILDANTNEKLEHMSETIFIRTGEDVVRNANEGRLFVTPEIQEIEE